MKQIPRRFLRTIGARGVGATFARAANAIEESRSEEGALRFHYVQIDVLTSQRLQGNPLAVFPDARGLSDEEMQDVARETNLQETTFVFPREPAIEHQHGIKVRIFVTNEEISFGGHPTLGTAMVLRDPRPAAQESGSAMSDDLDKISLDLQVGQVPVDFRRESSGNIFGEMHQIDPVFGPVHDRDTIAALLDLQPSDISAGAPIQSLYGPAFHHRTDQKSGHSSALNHSAKKGLRLSEPPESASVC